MGSGGRPAWSPFGDVGAGGRVGGVGWAGGPRRGGLGRGLMPCFFSSSTSFSSSAPRLRIDRQHLQAEKDWRASHDREGQVVMQPSRAET